MAKVRFAIIASILAVACSLVGCSEQDEVGEYDNWKARNEHYIDSIASLARANTDGTWTMIRAYNTGDSLDFSADNRYYIYVQKLADGTGTLRPQYNDSVRVHYEGRLIPSIEHPQGYQFGKSFNGTQLDASSDVPALLGVSGNVTGFATALMHMHVGDHWRVIVPYYLGYNTNTNSSGSIPAYSTLIFDMQLARIYRYKKDTDTRWW